MKLKNIHEMANLLDNIDIMTSWIEIRLLKQVNENYLAYYVIVELLISKLVLIILIYVLCNLQI